MGLSDPLSDFARQRVQVQKLELEFMRDRVLPSTPFGVVIGKLVSLTLPLCDNALVDIDGSARCGCVGSLALWRATCPC